MLRRLTQKGDTIIEVMIVLAVLGLAISIAYATANRSLLNARQAQENSEATRLIQSQLENLRILGADGPTPLTPSTNMFDNTAPFCINAGVKTTVSCSFGDENRYNIRIYYCTGSSQPQYAVCDASLKTATSKTFLIIATWDNVRGKGQDSSSFVYRYYGKWDAS